MNPSAPNTDVICCCSGTTEAQIKALVDSGVTDPERISRITGACSGCGACEPEVMQLLAEYPGTATEQRSHASADCSGA